VHGGLHLRIYVGFKVFPWRKRRVLEHTGKKFQHLPHIFVDALSIGAHGDPQCTLPLEIQDGGHKLKLQISHRGSNLEVIFTGYYNISMEIGLVIPDATHNDIAAFQKIQYGGRKTGSTCNSELVEVSEKFQRLHLGL